jgi:hypothetical protein
MAKTLDQNIKSAIGDLVVQLVEAQTQRDNALEQVAELQKQLESSNK